MIQYTYDEIATELGMTRSGVRKLEQRALRKVKKALDKRGMTLDDILPTTTHFEPEQTPWDTAE
jgi:DNA-directed RNA polymerase sigma subunit (sigma70/sigma32)